MKVLIAEDDRLMALLLTQLVRECEHEVVATVTDGGVSAIRSYAQHKPDVVLLDIHMPRCNGFTVCRAIRSRDPDAKVIFMSGQYEPEHPTVRDCGAAGYLRKPLLLEELRDALAAVAAQQKPDCSERILVARNCTPFAVAA